MKDPLAYTYDGLEQQINLLEIHLKEAPKGDEAFCKDCIDKHISACRGFCIEGPSFTNDKNEQNKFLKLEKQFREIKGRDYKKEGVELAQKVRNMRKELFEDCPDCSETIKNISKDLNTKTPLDDYTYNSDHISDPNQINLENKEMSKATYTELMYMNAGQFAAEGVRYLVDTQKPEWDKYVSIGGGIILQALTLVPKIPSTIKKIALVTGSNLLANGVIKMVSGTTNGVVGRAGAIRLNAGNSTVGKFTGRPNGRVFGGRVTATNVPTQYARAGIMAGAQAFGDPSHADMIRID